MNEISQPILIEKAWRDGEATFIEGWLSTPHPDRENHIIEPEAFENALDPYFALSAPVSYVHGTTKLPAGHLQKAAILRDGKVLKAVDHPTDRAEFESLPGSGSGVYIRGVLTDSVVGQSIKLGNTGGLSFTATASGELLPDGKKRFGAGSISTLTESTVAPYPINQQSRILLTKAEHQMDEKTISELIQKALTDAVTKLTPATPAAEVLTKADVEALLATERAAIKAEMETELQKATLTRGESAGRNGSVPPGEKNVITELLTKAQAGKAFDSMDDIALFKLTTMALTDGMKY